MFRRKDPPKIKEESVVVKETVIPVEPLLPTEDAKEKVTPLDANASATDQRKNAIEKEKVSEAKNQKVVAKSTAETKDVVQKKIQPTKSKPDAKAPKMPIKGSTPSTGKKNGKEKMINPIKTKPVLKEGLKAPSAKSNSKKAGNVLQKKERGRSKSTPVTKSANSNTKRARATTVGPIKSVKPKKSSVNTALAGDSKPKNITTEASKNESLPVSATPKDLAISASKKTEVELPVGAGIQMMREGPPVVSDYPPKNEKSKVKPAVSHQEVQPVVSDQVTKNEKSKVKADVTPIVNQTMPEETKKILETESNELPAKNGIKHTSNLAYAPKKKLMKVSIKIPAESTASNIPIPSKLTNMTRRVIKLKESISALSSLQRRILNPKNLIPEFSPEILEELKETDSRTLTEKFVALKTENLGLKKSNNDLQVQNAILNRRIIKEQEKTRMFPKATTIVPTSLEANIHLRHQYQKNLEKERKRYALLQLENERLVLETKALALQNIKERKVKSIEEQTVHNNEISYWKGKVRELEGDNLQILEILQKRDQQIMKLQKEKEYLYNEIVTMKRLHMHLSNSLDDSTPNAETQIPELINDTNREDNEKRLSTIAEVKVIPHYQEKLHRDTEIVMSPGNQARFNKLKVGKKPVSETRKETQNTDFQDKSIKSDIVTDVGAEKADQVVKPSKPSSFFLKKEKALAPEKQVQLNIDAIPTTSAETTQLLPNSPKHQRSVSTPLKNDPNALRAAKIQLEYQAYVKSTSRNRAKSDVI